MQPQEQVPGALVQVQVQVQGQVLAWHLLQPAEGAGWLMAAQ